MESTESRLQELVSPSKIQPAIDIINCTAAFMHNKTAEAPEPSKLQSNNVRFFVQPVSESSLHQNREEDSCIENFSTQMHHSERDFSLSSDPALNFVYSSNPDQMFSEDLLSGYGYIGSDPQAQLTVRSMASIGLGSSNGRKIHLRRVHTTGESFLSPLLTPPMGDGIQTPWPPKIVTPGKMLGSASSMSEASDCESDLEHVRISTRGRRLHGQLWGSRLEFLLACMGFAVGLGNIWRFPYTAYKSGGGALLIPYCIMVFLCGIPLQVLELAVGQYTRAGPVDAMKDICPLLSGVGVAMVVLSLFLSSYYSVVMGWAMLYLGSSFTPELPWTHCNNTWNTDNCRLVPVKSNASVIRPTVDHATHGAVNVSDTETYWRNWSTPGQEFFDRRVLQLTDGVNDPGDLHWELGICLVVAWLLLYISIRKSVRWSGKAVYLTSTLPYLLLLALTARALTMEGAHEGVRHLFYPDWSLLLNAEVWVNALAQTFMSVGIAYGSLIAFASYNRFHNPFISDAFCLSALNSFTSLVTGIIAFAALGHTAVTYNEPINETANDGLSFSLVMYTTVVSQMPFPQFWAVLLFLMFICLGLDTQFATIEVILLTLQRFLKLPCCRGCSKLVPDIIALGTCIVCLLVALPYISQGGIYLMQLTDYYVVTVGVILLAFIEALSTGVRYGASRLARNVREMTGHSPSPFLVVCWAGVTPMLILGVWIFHMIDLGDLTYNHGSYPFPSWTRTLGWSVVGCLLIPVPLLGIIAVYEADGKTIFQKVINSTKTQIKECPCCRRGVNGLKDTHSEVHLNEIGRAHPQVYAKITVPDDGSYQATISSTVQSPHGPIPVQFVVRSDDESEQESFRNPLG